MAWIDWRRWWLFKSFSLILCVSAIICCKSDRSAEEMNDFEQPTFPNYVKIDCDLQLLRKAGWKGQGGLGISEQGISQPLEAWKQGGRQGIGMHNGQAKNNAKNEPASTDTAIPITQAQTTVRKGSVENSSVQSKSKRVKRVRAPKREWQTVAVEEPLDKKVKRWQQILQASVAPNTCPSKSFPVHLHPIIALCLSLTTFNLWIYTLYSALISASGQMHDNDCKPVILFCMLWSIMFSMSGSPFAFEIASYLTVEQSILPCACPGLWDDIVDPVCSMSSKPCSAPCDQNPKMYISCSSRQQFVFAGRSRWQDVESYWLGDLQGFPLWCWLWHKSTEAKEQFDSIKSSIVGKLNWQA